MTRTGVAASAAVLLLVAGCGGNGDAATKSDTFTVKGQAVYATMDGCGGGIGALKSGTTVTVLDASGKKVALGKLGHWRADSDAVACRFPFRVAGVPDGGKVYTVRLEDGTTQDFTRRQAGKVFVDGAG